MVRPTNLGRPLAIRQGEIGFSRETDVTEPPPPPDDLLASDDATIETPYDPGSPVPVFLEKGYFGVAAASGVNITWSATPTPGRLLLLVVNRRNGDAPSSTTTPGWSVIAENVGAGSFDDTVAIFGKIAAGGEQSCFAGVPSTGSSVLAWLLFEVPGADLPAADTNTATGSGTGLTAGSVSTTGAGVIIGAWAQLTGSGSYTPTGLWTEVEELEPLSSHPSGVVVYQTVASTTTDEPESTSNSSAAWRGVAAAFDAGTGLDWQLAPEVQDDDDGTYMQVDDDDGGYIARAMLEAEYAIIRSVLRIGAGSAGTETIELYGADEADFSDEVLIGSQTWAATGSYTSDELTFVTVGAGAHQFYRIAGPADVRIYTWEMYGSTDATLASLEAELDAHIADTTDAHDASAVSIVDAGNYFTGTDVEAALQELGASGGGSGTPATTVESETTYGITPAVGTDTEYARQDHTHGSPSGTVAIVYVIDGGGSAITTGSKGFIEVPFGCTITAWRVAADASGAIVVDVKKATYAGLFTTTSIAASAKPTLSGPAQKNEDTTLTGWTTSVSAGDWLEFVVDSATTVTRVTVTLTATRT